MNVHTGTIAPFVPPMNAEQRSRLRRAVGTNPGWKLYRENHGAPSMDKITTQQLWEAALGLGLNPYDAMNDENMNREHKPRPFDREACQKLCDRFWNVVMSEKEQTLCIDIINTIFDKQDGRATIRQYELVDRIVTKAEEAAQNLRPGAKDWLEQLKAAKAAQKPAGTFPGNGGTTIEAIAKATGGLPIEPQRPLIKPASNTPAEQLAKLLEQLTPQAPQLDEAAIEAVIDRKVKEALAGVPQLTINLVRTPGKAAEPLPGLHHKLFPDLLQVIAARTAAGKPLNIWIAGPAASGKTSAAMKVAEALDRNFYGNGAVTFAEQLFGFIDAHGVYHTTAFRNAYEHGGVYVFDDTDGSDVNATTAFNMGLENGVCPFPDRMVERHPDCVIIATANTWGSGATADYVGRNKLDGAFLDRFGVKLPWDYDIALESAVSGNPDWAQRVIAARARARAAGLKVLITPRASIAGAALIAQGMSADKAASYTYLANLTAEQRRMVEGE
jgi:hypothetical protein